MRLSMLALLLLAAGAANAADYPAPVEADAVFKSFKFHSGEVLPELRIHYKTVGTARRNARGEIDNAVLIMHGTTGSGGQFIRPEFAGELFGAGQPLDASKYFIVLPDDIGHGKSSRPSEGMHAHFPHYRYLDMVDAEHRLMTETLGVKHLRLVMGTSMGGMHTWLWGELYPTEMDALMPLASLPTQIAGRNRAWRRLVIDAIRNDPEWRGGDYQKEPQSLRTAAEMLWLVGSNPVLRQKAAPTVDQADTALETYADHYQQSADANDVLYAIESSGDYDPAPGLSRIKARLLAVNSADDLINPPELGILEAGIKQVPNGRAIIIPLSDKTRGHGSHTVAALWKDQLLSLLQSTTARN